MFIANFDGYFADLKMPCICNTDCCRSTIGDLPSEMMHLKGDIQVVYYRL